MDKNTITGLILCVLVVIGFSYFNRPSAEELARQKAKQDSIAVVEANKAKAEIKKAEADSAAFVVQSQALLADSTAIFANCVQGNKENIVLENDSIKVEISSKGGTIEKVSLKGRRSYADFRANKANDLVLFDGTTQNLNLTFETKERNISTSDYYFTAAEKTDSSVVMRMQDATTGAKIDLCYALHGPYMVDFTVKTAGMNNLFSTKTKSFAIHWEDNIRQLEKGYDFEYRYSPLTYKTTDDVEKVGESKGDEEKAEYPVEWIAFKNQYFSAVLIAKDCMNNVNVCRVQDESKGKSGFLSVDKADAEAKFDASGKQATEMQFYFGPNNYRLLQKMEAFRLGENDLDLQELVYLGWPIVRWINRFFTLYVFDFLTRLGLPMGWILILITLLLRVIVYMPTKKSFMSSAKMRVLKPKVDEIAKKYPNKEDAMKRQQETMTLYSQYGTSPMGGCLPMLIQMPIWIAMFNFVPNAIEMRQQSLLWAEDLSAYDDVINWGTNIWGIGDHLSLFCVLFCATNVLYSYLTMRQQRESMSGEQAEQMKMMQWMMYLMPLMFFFMFNTYSAGLNFYYFISLLFSALTMWYLRKTTDDKKLLEKLEAYYQANKNNPQKKTSGLAARLEALQKEQEARLQEQRRKNGRG